MTLESQIESILFYKNEPVELGKICEWLQKNEQEVKEAVEKLKTTLAERGVTLIEESGAYMLATTPAAASLIDKIAREELSRELGKAGLETLSIILYKGKTTRREIDYIRGVNSTFILRVLLIRGLIEREEDKNDSRVFVYKPTFALLAHLGLKKIEHLPKYEQIKKEIEECLITQ
jgi:segregation and condensation protein B